MCDLVTSKTRAAGLTLSLFAFVLLASANGQAALITHDFTAEVTNVSGGLPQFDTTQTITGSFTYESTTPPRVPGSPDPSEQSTFDALTNFEFSIDGFSASSSASAELQLDDFGAADRFALVSRASDGLTGPDANGNALLGFILRIDYFVDSIDDASVLPATIPFDPAIVLSTLVLVDFANGQQVVGQLTSFELQQAPPAPGTEVPEPSSLAIFFVVATVTGGAGFARRRADRRR